MRLPVTHRPALSNAIRAIAISVVALASVGCAHRSPTPSLAAASAQPELADWWKRFDDPILTVMIRKSVETNVDAALKADPSDPTRLPEARASSLAGKDVENPLAAIGERIFGQLNLTIPGQPESVAGLTEERVRTVILQIANNAAAAYVETRGLQARLELAKREGRHDTASQLQIAYERSLRRLASITGDDIAELEILMDATSPVKS